MSLQTAQFYMPARGERSAPSYNKSRPRELVRFFKELERLFVRTSMTSDKEKKEQVLRYVDFEEEEFWQTLPEFKSSMATYDDFKAAIFFCYPDASGDYLYSLHDVDLLIMERLQVGINNATDLADFHLRFHQITSWLVSKDHLCELEQRRAYVRAFRPPLMSLITNRLQIKFPDLHPNIPYPIRDVYDAAQYILHKLTSRPQHYVAPIPASSATALHVPATPEKPITSEDLQKVFTDLTKTIADVLDRNSRGMDRSAFNRNNRDSNPSGAAYLRHPTDNSSTHVNKLSPDDRIAQIEAELYALRASESRFIHRADNARSTPMEDSYDDVSAMEKAPEKEITPNIIAMSKYDPIAPVIVSVPHPAAPRHVDPKQEHRTLEAKGIADAPFIDRNVGVSISHIRSKSETAPKARLSVYEAPMAIDPDVRLQDTRNAITQRHCLPLLPEVCAQTQKIAATCRKLTRTAHVFQSRFEVSNSKASDFSASPVVGALVPASSTLVSDLTVSSATSGDSLHQQLCPDNPSSLLPSSATSLAFSDEISVQNKLETPIGDLHTTSDSSCDYIQVSSISDSAFATIPATLELHLEQSFSSSNSNKHTFSSDICDISDPDISKSDSATPNAISTVSNHSDICDSDLKFELNLVTSDIAVVFNHTEALQALNDICDPFWNIPALDLRLSPYKPNSRYQQDRKPNIIVFLHLLMSCAISLVSTSLSITFSKGAQHQRHHIFWSSLWSHFVEFWSHLCSSIRYSRDLPTPFIFALSQQFGKRMSLLCLNAIGLVIVWSLFGRSALGLHNSFSATRL